MTARQHKIYIWTLSLAFVSVVVVVLAFGVDFYMTPVAQRLFHPQYSLLKPSGHYGYLLGIVGTSMIVLGVVIYMLKKRVPKLSQLGKLRYWLEMHIFLCVTGPMLVVFHTSLKVGGLALYAFFGMLCVMMSGVTGRFLYGLLPRDADGLALSPEELEASIALLAERLEQYSETLRTTTNSYLADEGCGRHPEQRAGDPRGHAATRRTRMRGCLKTMSMASSQRSLNASARI